MNNYLVGISALINAVLLMVLFGIIPFLLYTSVIVNIFMIWFIARTLNQAEEMRVDIDASLESLEAFSDHLDNLYGLETFYGDQSLKELIDHSREVINDIVDFQEKYYNAEVELKTYDDSEDQEAPPETEESVFHEST